MTDRKEKFLNQVYLDYKGLVEREGDRTTLKGIVETLRNQGINAYLSPAGYATIGLPKVEICTNKITLEETVVFGIGVDVISLVKQSPHKVSRVTPFSFIDKLQQAYYERIGLILAGVIGEYHFIQKDDQGMLLDVKELVLWIPHLEDGDIGLLLEYESVEHEKNLKGEYK